MRKFSWLLLGGILIVGGCSWLTAAAPRESVQLVPQVDGVTLSMNWLNRNLLWSQGKGIVVATVGIGAIGVVVSSSIIVAAAVGLFIFSYYFFRNPVRTCERALHDARVIVSPADGKVVEIVDIEDGFVGSARRISIFLSPLDVHVQWIPLTGKML